MAALVQTTPQKIRKFRTPEWVRNAPYNPILLVLSSIHVGTTWGGQGLAIWLPFAIYLLPPLVFRCLVWVIYPELKGNLRAIPKSSLRDSKAYRLWWASVLCQSIYLRIPQFEEIIRMVPGLYSAWLRLWGARVGKNVFWAPGVMVMDRPFIEVGDDVIVGTRSMLACHLVRRADDIEKTQLYIEGVVIGDSSTIGGDCKLGPGARLAQGQALPTNSMLSRFSPLPSATQAASSPSVPSPAKVS